MRKIKQFLEKHIVFLFSIFFGPAAYITVCWVEANKYRRLTAAGIMFILGIIAVIYAHKTDPKRKAKKEECEE